MKKQLFFLLLLFGLITLLFGLLCQLPVLKLISDRPVEEFNIEGPRLGLLLGGSLLVFISFVWLRLVWLHEFLGENRIARTSFVIFIGFLFATFNLEMILRTLFVHSKAQLAERSIQYKPTALGNFVIDERDQDLLTFSLNEPEVRTRLRGGYRHEKIEFPKPQDAVRIIIFGGSHVFDPFTPADESWPQQTQKLLLETGIENVEIINAGVPGYRTFDAITALLGELHFFEPDYFVLCCTYNDLKYFSWIDEERTPLRNLPVYKENPLTSNSSVGDQLFGEFRIYIALKKWWVLNREGKEVSTDLDIAQESKMLRESNCKMAHKQYQLNLETIISICQNADIQPILFSESCLVTSENMADVKQRMESQSTGLTLEAIAREYEHCDSILEEVAAKHSIPFFDLAQPIRGRSDYFSDIIHLSTDGRKAVAERAADYFQTLLQPKHDTTKTTP